MSHLRRGLAVALVLVIAVGMGGCSLDHFKKTSAQVPEYVESILSDPKTFNSALSQESPNIFGYTYEGLTTVNPITSAVEPALAQSWQISPDQLKIVFTLRPNLKWSDGEPLTADDVIFTYNEIYLNEAIPAPARDILMIGADRALPRVKKLSPDQVEFTVPEPFAPFLRVAGGLAILPAHALQQSVRTKNSAGKPQFLAKWGVDTPPDQIIVNGPYQLDRYLVSQRVIFRRNPYYWRYQVPGQAQGNIERLVWQIVENQDTQLLQFRSGGLDAVGVLPDRFSLLKREEKQGDFTIYGRDLVKDLSPATSFILFNLNTGRRNNKPLVDPIKSKWFNTVEFRQAIAYAIDRRRMLTNIFRGLGNFQNSPLSVQSPYYLSPEEGLKTYDYNPTKAQDLLQRAGFKYNIKEELFDAQGNRVRFVLTTNAGNQVREAIGAQIKQDLAKIGIQVDYTPLAFGTIVNKLSDSLEWECVLLGLTGGVEPNNGATVWSPEGRLHMFNQNPPPGSDPIQGRTVSDWEQEIGDLYIQGAQELDEAKRKEIYAKTQQITQENLPFIYLINPLSMTAVRNDFEGIKYTPLGGAFWNIYDIRNTEALTE